MISSQTRWPLDQRGRVIIIIIIIIIIGSEEFEYVGQKIDKDDIPESNSRNRINKYRGLIAKLNAMQWKDK